jgi:crotonobetainyl-CoA:carnitine CoA-transferase CaiB-like acyl-CoA transferase
LAGALDGIRVLDLSRVLAGPWATQLLGDFGADVVKVERPGVGDETRSWGPPWLGGTSGESAYFLSCNRNKRSLTLDLAQAAGQSVARELALRADVLIENFRFGAPARFGLAPETLLREHPMLVYCSISAYDSGSSRSGEPGYDAMIQAAGGFMSITGPEGGGPQKAGVAIADIMTGMYAASAILAALHSRDRSGRGQKIEVPLFDAQVASLANQNLNYLLGGRVPDRLGTAHPNIVPYQAFATADGDLMLAVGNDRQFRACIASLGVQDRLGDERFANNAMRVRNRDELVSVLAPAFARRTTADWLTVLTKAGVPCGPINSLEAVFASDYAREQRLVRRVRHADDPELPTVANPVRFAETPVAYSQAPPLLGADSDEVLREWLGYSPERIATLREAGTI